MEFLSHDLILDEGADLACITETYVYFQKFVHQDFGSMPASLSMGGVGCVAVIIHKIVI